MVWTCFPFIRSGQNHIAGHSEREKKRRQTENEVGRYIKEWTGLEFARQVSQSSGKKRRKKTEKKVICGAPKRRWRVRGA